MGGGGWVGQEGEVGKWKSRQGGKGEKSRTKRGGPGVNWGKGRKKNNLRATPKETPLNERGKRKAIKNWRMKKKGKWELKSGKRGICSKAKRRDQKQQQLKGRGRESF